MYNKNNHKAVSKEHAEYIAKIKKRKLLIRLTQISILIIFIALWELTARLKIIDAFITSQPSRIINTLISLHEEGTLWMHISISILETIVGFILGTAFGTAIAIILWWSDFAAKVADPYLVVLNSLPKVALGPIIIVWIGAGPFAIITMALLVSLIVTIITVLNGFLEINPDKIKLLQTFGATKLQILKKVILPASIPTIISALKINVGMSWVGVVVGEFLVSKAGLGHLIVYGGQVFKLDLVMTSIFILSIAAVLMYQFTAWLEKKLIKWQN
ncbi:MAG: ABC transporter permease [Caldicoprobacterales bacterium]|jgi:NitT/TauT family transport system permease protein|nr:ABC transporter permease [Clostridiales bacterium]